MSAYSTPIPTPDASRDLTDAEFAELDDLLAATPEPLTPCDVVMLDGYLCGVLVQPVIHTPDEWLPFVFDFDGQPLPDDADPVWKARATALILRRHDALNRSLVEDGWFDPLVLEFDEENPMQPAAEGEADPMAGLSPIAQSLMPWVAGFQHAAVSFPDLIELGDDTIDSTLARLYRFLPAENDEERELVALLDAEHPITTLEQGIEDMVMTVAELADLTRDERYHVETVKRETPKLGRNDPCHCGSGKKFKACHGK